MQTVLQTLARACKPFFKLVSVCGILHPLTRQNWRFHSSACYCYGSCANTQPLPGNFPATVHSIPFYAVAGDIPAMDGSFGTPVAPPYTRSPPWPGSHHRFRSRLRQTLTPSPPLPVRAAAAELIDRCRAARRHAFCTTAHKGKGGASKRPAAAAGAQMRSRRRSINS